TLIAEPRTLAPHEHARRAHDGRFQVIRRDFAVDMLAHLFVSDRPHRSRVAVAARDERSHLVDPSRREPAFGPRFDPSVEILRRARDADEARPMTLRPKAVRLDPSAASRARELENLESTADAHEIVRREDLRALRIDARQLRMKRRASFFFRDPRVT